MRFSYLFCSSHELLCLVSPSFPFPDVFNVLGFNYFLIYFVCFSHFLLPLKLCATPSLLPSWSCYYSPVFPPAFAACLHTCLSGEFTVLVHGRFSVCSFNYFISSIRKIFLRIRKTNANNHLKNYTRSFST